MGVLGSTDSVSYSLDGLNLKNTLGVNTMTQSLNRNNQGGEESGLINKGLLNSEKGGGVPGSSLGGPFDRDSVSNDLGAKMVDTEPQQPILQGRTGTILSKLV